ncbi:sigma 54-interacting transcriptional regulator [bacterium]|nr:sigma 54-interacting transcriptional regulator [bacterium]
MAGASVCALGPTDILIEREQSWTWLPSWASSGLRPEHAWRFLDAVLESLEYIHAVGMIHHGLAPEWVWVDDGKQVDDGIRVHILGFHNARKTPGLSRAYPGDSFFRPVRDEEFGPQYDVYSAAAMCVSALARSLEVQGALLARPLSVLDGLAGELPSRMTEVLRGFLSSQPGLRPRDAQEGRERLRGAGIVDLAPLCASLQQSNSGIIRRDSASSALRAAVLRIQDGRVGLVLLVGPPGAGKSSIERDCRLEALLAGAEYSRVERAHALPPEEPGREPPLPRRADLSASLSEASACVSVGFLDDVDHLTGDQIDSVLQVLSVAHARHESLLLVATCADLPPRLLDTWSDVGRAAPVRTGSGAWTHVIELGPLTLSEVDSCLGELMAARPSSVMTEWVLRQTGGHPRFVGELGRHLFDAGLIERSPDGMKLVAAGLSGTAMPSTLQELVRDRVALLSTDVLEVLRMVALGRCQSVDLVVSLTGFSRDFVKSAADRLTRLHLLRQTADTDVLAVAYDVLKAELLVQMGDDRIAVLSRRTAEVLADDPSLVPPSANPEVLLAEYWLAAREYERAFGHAIDAARQMLDRGLASEAVDAMRLMDQAWRACRRAGPEMVEDVSALAESCWQAGLSAACSRACEIGIEILRLERHPTPELLFELHWKLGRAASLRGDPDAAMTALEVALAVAEAAGDHVGAAKVFSSMCIVHHMRAEFHEIERLADRSIEILRSQDPEGTDTRRMLAAGYNAKGNALCALCRWTDAASWYRKAARMAVDAESVDRRSVMICNIGLAHTHLGEWEQAGLRYDEALGMIAATSPAYPLQLINTNRAILLIRRGALEEAELCLNEARSRAQLSGDDWDLSLIGLVEGQLEFERGNSRVALRVFEDSEALMARVGCVDDKAELWRSRAEALHAVGRSDQAGAVVERARTLAVETDNALEVACCARVRGNLALGLHNLELAASECGEAVSSLRALGAPYELGEALVSLAEVQTASGDSGLAASTLHEATALFAKLGAKSKQRQAQERLSALNGLLAVPSAELPSDRRRLASLCTSSQLMTRAVSLSDVAREVADVAFTALPVDLAVVEVRNCTTADRNQRFSRPNPLPSSDEVARLIDYFEQHAPERAATLVLSECDTDRHDFCELLSAAGLSRAAFCGIVSRGNSYGVLLAGASSSKAAFTDNDIRFVEALAAQAATALENIELRGKLEEEIETLRWEVDGRYSFSNIIGRSVEMQKVFSLLERVSSSSATVLIEGESGTGKELVARAIHYNSPRKNERFVPQNCAALPEQLLESELFGHVRGAFTGALKEKRGLFEAADGGTFFLDEIADMPPSLQVKLLRVLQDGEVRRVGATDSISVDVRIVAAANKSLEEEVKAGRFRQDLYYRLNVVRVEMPPLRVRRDDIPLLAQHFLDAFVSKSDRAIEGFTDGAMGRLVNYDWPGNVRELENEMQRAVALARDDAPISERDLSPRVRACEVSVKTPKHGVGLDLKDMVQDIERRVILQMLEEFSWNKSRTAEALGLSRQGLLKKIARLKLRPADK